MARRKGKKKQPWWKNANVIPVNYAGLNEKDFNALNSDLYSTSFDDNMKAMDSLQKELKTLDGGKTNYMPGYRYKTPKSKRHKAGDKVPRNDNVKAPNGTKWKNETGKVTQRVWDYENTDVFSDFDGNFFLQKIGNEYRCWIVINDSHVIDDQGNPTAKSSIVSGKKICENKWTDEDGQRSFALSSIAAHFAKHNITEDMPKDGGFPHVYKDINMGCGAVKYWNILDGGPQNDKPKIIAHAGETIIIDTGRMKVKKSDGTDLTRYTSFDSEFPPLYGGQINNIDFSPTVGTDCDVDVQYIPRIK